MTAVKITHTEWQQQIIDLAHALHWRHLHVRRTIGRGRKWVTATNVIGWPDLFLWNERQRRTLAVELKVHPDKPTPDQLDVLGSLRAAGIEVHVWYPDDLETAHMILAEARP